MHVWRDHGFVIGILKKKILKAKKKKKNSKAHVAIELYNE